MKRLLFLIHRWVGVGLALLMSLWFFSGLVILYSVQLNQNRAQQLAHAELLQPEDGWLSLGEAWQRSGAERKPESKPDAKPIPATLTEARLVRRAGQPQWLVDDSAGRRFAISASHGTLLATSAATAAQIAAHWVNGADSAQATPVRFVETVERPMIVRNQDGLRPFHRFAVDDGLGSELYISARSGDVVHASTRVERGFYWAGNWLHLFRFLDLTSAGEARGEILMWSVIAAFVACLTGLVIGWLRWRPGVFGKATYGEGRVHPYRQFWFRWHFWAGLVGGTFALLWALSGFFNGNTWKLFTPATPSHGELARFYGSGLPATMRDWKPEPLGEQASQVVELSWRRLGNEAVLLAYTRNGQRQALTTALPKFNKFSQFSQFSDGALSYAARRMAGASLPTTQQLLTEYDGYYYPRQGRGTMDRPLPVMRIEIDDAAGTCFYIDPADGRLLLRQDQSRRAYRWLFNALHYWDIGWLHVRPLWDAWMLAWIGFGLVLSVSSLVLGWRRLTLSFRRRKNPAAVAAPRPALANDNAGS